MEIYKIETGVDVQTLGICNYEEIKSDEVIKGNVDYLMMTLKYLERHNRVYNINRKYKREGLVKEC